MAREPAPSVEFSALKVRIIPFTCLARWTSNDDELDRYPGLPW